MKRLDLAHIPSEYRKEKDILTALAWNAVKKTLEEKKREEIFPYIQSVRLTDKYIVITTGKPIINEELLSLSPTIAQRFYEASLIFGGKSKREVKLM